MSDLNTNIVLAECYGMLIAMRDDASEQMAEMIDSQLSHIEAVMGTTGREWRAKRISVQEAAA